MPVWAGKFFAAATRLAGHAQRQHQQAHKPRRERDKQDGRSEECRHVPRDLRPEARSSVMPGTTNLPFGMPAVSREIHDNFS